MPNFSVLLQKTSQRTLNESVIKENLRAIVGRALAGSRTAQGWFCDKYEIPKPNSEGGYLVYRVSLNFRKKKYTELFDESQFENLVRMLSGACSGNGKWQVVKAGEEDITTSSTMSQKEIEKLNTDLGEYFKDIYDRDPQIEIIHSSLIAFEDSDRENRFHCVLHGDPGGGKTDILLTLEKMLGEDAVLKLDMSSTTKAGIERLLLESEYIKPVVICEEVEKQQEAALLWLLGVLDQRGEIRKTNYRIGTQSRSVKMLCFATVNNMPLFKTVMSGALASRFPNKIYCPRPNEEVMYRILLREVHKVNGNEDWIAPTLKFCKDNNINDPREAKTICLCGRDKLLTGKYQECLKITRNKNILE